MYGALCAELQDTLQMYRQNTSVRTWLMIRIVPRFGFVSNTGRRFNRIITLQPQYIVNGFYDRATSALLYLIVTRPLNSNKMITLSVKSGFDFCSNHLAACFVDLHSI